MKRNNLIIILLIIGLFLSGYIIPHYLIEILGFYLILFVTLRIGWKKALITAIFTSLIMFIDHMFFNYQKPLSHTVNSILILNFAVPLFIGRHVKIIRDKNNELDKIQKKLKEKNNLLESILANAPVGIWVVDEDQNLILVNEYFKEKTGFGTENVSFKKKELKKCKETDNKALNSGEIERFEETSTFKDGKKHILQTVKTKIEINKKETLGILGIGLDITERKQKEEKIKKISFHDYLTELYNRRYFENELDRLNNSRKLPITIIVADIDDLKQINDNYGHQMGDDFIKKTAKILNNTVRDEDIVARTGGDEFAIILPETDKETSKNLVNRIKNEFKRANEKNNLPEPLKIFLGYATKKSKSEDLNEVFDIADKRMYKKKSKK